MLPDYRNCFYFHLRFFCWEEDVFGNGFLTYIHALRNRENKLLCFFHYKYSFPSVIARVECTKNLAITYVRSLTVPFKGFFPKRNRASISCERSGFKVGENEHLKRNEMSGVLSDSREHWLAKMNLTWV